MPDNEKVDSGAEASASKPDYSEDGVDLTLIRWMLSLTPAERLQALQDNLWSLERLRRGRFKD